MQLLFLIINPEKRNYNIWNKELLAITATFEEWQHLLDRTPFPVQVLTDNKKTLKSISTEPVI